jgi:7-keto-8-aminopelargonate synthetase-like enzyme
VADLYSKCNGFFANAESARAMGYPANPRMLQALGLYPYFIPIDRSRPEVVIEGQRLVMLGSNNYLGLTTHPEVKEAAIEAIRRHGTGCTGSRFMNGTLRMHLELQERLARFVGKEDSLVFTTGYQTNLGTVAALAGKRDVVIADEEVHASVIDGIRLSAAGRDGHAHFSVIVTCAPGADPGEGRPPPLPGGGGRRLQHGR